MNYFRNAFLATTFLISSPLISQIGGNQIYQSSNSYNNYNSHNRHQNSVVKNTVYSTDSTLVISANILMNKLADNYLITVGLNQEALTVIECNKEINRRIAALNKDLRSLEVSEDDTYVDFISQTKIYDYELSKTQSTQFQSGFEIKKNIIIKINDLSKIDLLIEYCAKQEIYDIIKVDYVNDNINKTYEEMYEEALSFIETRKKMYLRASSQKESGSSRIVSDNFYSVYPKTQYQKFEAFETSSLSVQRNYPDHYVQKEARKNKTYYYEGVQVSSFDKIINSSTPKIGIQYILSISMVYELEE